MKKWNLRVKEEAYLLNPAFIAGILAASINGYHEKKNEAMPYPFAFMIPPIILHKNTRELLPRYTTTSLLTWLYENPKVKLNFFNRAKSLQPYIKEALLFGLNEEEFKITDAKINTSIPYSRINRELRNETDETVTCIKEARFLGRWFAISGDVKTIMSLWGVKP